MRILRILRILRNSNGNFLTFLNFLTQIFIVKQREKKGNRLGVEVAEKKVNY